MLRKPVSHVRAYLLLGSALLLCPCHLPLLLGLVAGGVGGSAFASFLSQNVALVAVFATAYFVFALWMGRRLLTRNEAQATTTAKLKGAHRNDCC
jgi:mercuric ion transport protein